MKCNHIIIAILITILVSSSMVTVEASYRVLQQGMEGRDIRELQENLVMLGHRIIIDGKFGPATKRAVIQFQNKSKLPSDGIVGQSTWESLKEAISFDKYKVRSGDTLSALAHTYDVPVTVIKEANKLSSDTIKIDQELIIPKTALGGPIDTDFYEIVSYKVQRRDTLDKLASRFHTTIRTIKKVNNLETVHIREGEIIKIPKLVIDLSNTSINTTSVKKDFIWPVRGRISSGYGWRVHPILNKKHFHGGLDIAVKRGTSVKAAKSGVVLGSGWVSGFGKTVTIDHGNGVVTLYAHNSRLLVKQGQRVNQGQIIAKSGSTGRSTGPHVDFRILIDNKPVNPLKYLNK
ncbi:peptidoglycan DD-metalloendopeptidase family protein [Orenia marismortui]|uniref:Murein DD-endopeptidase MepM/ murein hydrolase activator NlpD n=1 Tax=Orenia marismortui TaxID=46469 RepID=A0A4R8H5U5_9FIRM|nr:peptidoglycan DD-metalloendopeptidase family protein [Orenia marismortui]TDX52720.1 murein DD-endopeptidase MepM/ murein hydrolase activator NlpD [Orenia marismortui]